MHKKSIFFLGGLFLFSFPLFSHADEDLGYFYNDTLQNVFKQPYNLTFQNKKYPFYVKDYSSWELFLFEKENYASEIENPFFCPEKLKGLSVCDLTRPISTSGHYKKAGKLVLKKELVLEELKDIAMEIDRSPQNGTLSINEEGRVDTISQSKDGQKLDVEKSFENIKNTLVNAPKETSIPLVVEELKAEVSTNNLDSYGIKEIIAHGESNFRGSPVNRIHNIKTAVARFHGLLIKPGEEFSFTTNLGEVDGEHGYKEELVIKDNQTIPEFGGGICQVSTTMFRAALNGGLKITERHNHAYPVQYYAPQGSDATVYIPKPDLRFLNDTPAYILVQAKIEGTVLSFDFYGTSDGRRTEIEGPQVTEKTPDNKMKTIMYQRVYDSSGNQIRESIFKSFYDDPAKYHHEPLKEKPKDWSKKQWKEYQAQQTKPSN